MEATVSGTRAIYDSIQHDSGFYAHSAIIQPSIGIDAIVQIIHDFIRID